MAWLSSFSDNKIKTEPYLIWKDFLDDLAKESLYNSPYTFYDHFFNIKNNIDFSIMLLNNLSYKDKWGEHRLTSNLIFSLAFYAEQILFSLKESCNADKLKEVLSTQDIEALINYLAIFKQLCSDAVKYNIISHNELMSLFSKSDFNPIYEALPVEDRERLNICKFLNLRDTHELVLDFLVTHLIEPQRNGIV